MSLLAELDLSSCVVFMPISFESFKACLSSPSFESFRSLKLPVLFDWSSKSSLELLRFRESRRAGEIKSPLALPSTEWYSTKFETTPSK